MRRKGQLTIFMLLGVVLLLLVGFLLYLVIDSADGSSDDTLRELAREDTGQVKLYLMSLLEDVMQEVVIGLVGPQGGYADSPPQPSVLIEEYPIPQAPIILPSTGEVLGPHEVPYFYRLGTFSISPIEDLEEQLTQQVIARFRQVLDLRVFEEQGYQLVIPDSFPATEFQPDDPFRIKIQLNAEDITAILEFPIELRAQQGVQTLDDMEVILPIRLKTAHRLAQCLVEKVVFDEGRDTADDSAAPNAMPYYEDSLLRSNAYEECKDEFALLDVSGAEDLVVRTGLFTEGPGSINRGRLVAIEDHAYFTATGHRFALQYLIWKCSGGFHPGGARPDEARLMVCEHACVRGLPEALALSACEQAGTCDSPAIGSCTGVSSLDGHELDSSILSDAVECHVQSLIRGKNTDAFQGMDWRDYTDSLDPFIRSGGGGYTTYQYQGLSRDLSICHSANRRPGEVSSVEI